MDIPAAIDAVSGALTVVKQLRDIDKDYERAALKSQMAGIYNDLADVKMALTDAIQEIHDKDQKIKELEQKHRGCNFRRALSAMQNRQVEGSCLGT